MQHPEFITGLQPVFHPMLPPTGPSQKCWLINLGNKIILNGFLTDVIFVEITVLI